MRLGAVLVHYHTPALVVPATLALVAAATKAGVALTVVVVDNGSTPEGRDALIAAERTGHFRLIEAGANLGYAGGVNLGVKNLPPADAYVLMNPDVMVEEGAFAPLLAELERGAGIVGPRFYWDQVGHFQLPMIERHRLRDEWHRAWAPWSSGRAAAARRAWRSHVYPFFQASGPVDGFELSGAMLVASDRAWQRVGPFDESFALYFEETDWLARAQAAGVRATFVPAAEALHLYAQSTPQGGAHDRFEASRRIFRRRRWGRVLTATFEHLERATSRRPSPPPAAEELSPDGELPTDPSASILEISPSPLGFPAAYRHLVGGLTAGCAAIPPSLRGRIAPGVYWLRTLDGGGNERRVFRIAIPAQAKSLSPSV